MSSVSNEVAAQDNDIMQFDSVTRASVGHEFEVKDPAGNPYPTPLYFTVVGRQAHEVTSYYARLLDEAVQRRALAERRGKPVEPKTADQLRRETIEGAAVRVVGWRGVKQPFARETLRRALERNPHWIDQITEESEDLANFT